MLERGPAHGQLNFLIGRWAVATERRRPISLELEGETAFRWDHGGAWLVGEQIVELEGTGTIHNFTMMTYHPREQRWNGVWWDNVSPTVVPFHATWRDERTLVLDSGEIDFGGRIHRSVATLTRVDDCRVRKRFRWSWDGGELQGRAGERDAKGRVPLSFPLRAKHEPSNKQIQVRCSSTSSERNLSKGWHTSGILPYQSRGRGGFGPDPLACYACRSETQTREHGSPWL